MVSEHEKLDIGKAYYKDGIKKGKMEDAEAMLKFGLSVGDIRKITGLSIKDVQDLNN